MDIKKLVVGPLGVNCFVIADEASAEAMVVDPGDEPDRIEELIREKGCRVDIIVCTHAHFDHIGAVGDIKKATGARILLSRKDIELYRAARDQAAIWGYEVDDLPDPDGYLDEGDSVKVGGLNFKVLATPGHSPGGICLYGEGVVITGDTIFQGSVGRTDFHGGDVKQLAESFRRLLSLPEETAVFCGHGPDTSVGREKRENFFVSEFL